MRGRGKTNQISKRIKLLPHQATLPPPPRNLPVHEIEKQPKRHERQRRPQVSVCARGPETVAHGGEDGHDAAETWDACLVYVYGCMYVCIQGCIPLSSVMRSARCNIRIIEKCPVSSARSFFCLSTAVESKVSTVLGSPSGVVGKHTGFSDG